MGLKLLCEGALARMCLALPCTLVKASSGVHVLGLPAGLFPTVRGSRSGSLFEAESWACVTGCCEAGAYIGPSASSRLWCPEPARAGLHLDLAASEPCSLGQIVYLLCTSVSLFV